MCEWGTTTPLEVTIPAHLSATGEARRKVVGVDACIHGIVQALNEAGVPTVASCCGHGKQPGNIALSDGREIRIMTYEQSRQVDELFPPINPRPQSEPNPG